MPNTFKFADVAEVYGADSVKVWYSKSGVIYNSQCADYYRVGKLDPQNIGLVGEFKDYDLQGHLLYKASYLNGMLNGIAAFYYPNGKTMETGKYENDARVGIWRYYYENGIEEKVLNFEAEVPTILSYNDEKGKALLVNGEGQYRGSFKQWGSTTPFAISGHVTKGKMDGEWKFMNTLTSKILSIEVFNDGKFSNGFAPPGSPRYVYNDQSKIQLSGFYGQEQLRWDEGISTCPGSPYTVPTVGPKSLKEGFYIPLIKDIEAYSTEKKQWVMVGITFDGLKKVKDVIVYSSIDDVKMEQHINNYIRQIKTWKAGSQNGNAQPLFFTLNIDNTLEEKVIIPAEYRWRSN
ncbi:toxin-antitoxin system YwqK family antitoxin [Mucilaginibacter conchicola]|nr:hypothetical protein [Mucilaginibacter conchicola]